VLTLPWTTTHPNPDGACTVIVGRLPLRAYRDLPAGVAWVRRVGRQLAVTPGLAGHATAIDLSAPALWIVSAWTNRADLVRFEHSDEHQAARSGLSLRLWPATFAVWMCGPTDLPVTWTEVRRRIDAASHTA
jgi:hypothetical protein